MDLFSWFVNNMSWRSLLTETRFEAMRFYAPRLEVHNFWARLKEHCKGAKQVCGLNQQLIWSLFYRRIYPNSEHGVEASLGTFGLECQKDMFASGRFILDLDRVQDAILRSLLGNIS